MKDIPYRYAKRYPEVALFPDRASADEAIKAWKSRILKTPSFWMQAIALGVLVAMFALTIILLARAFAPLSAPAIAGSSSAICGASAAMVFRFAARRRLRGYLRERLNEKGVPVCLACGRELRGQTDPRCPECGTPYEPNVEGSDDPPSH